MQSLQEYDALWEWGTDKIGERFCLWRPWHLEGSRATTDWHAAAFVEDNPRHSDPHVIVRLQSFIRWSLGVHLVAISVWACSRRL